MFYFLTYASVRHANHRMIDQLTASFHEGRLFDRFEPMPIYFKDPELNQMERFIWLAANWGPSADVQPTGLNCCEIKSPHHLWLSLETEGAAPLPIMKKWKCLGFEVAALVETGLSGGKSIVYIDGTVAVVPPTLASFC